MRRWTGSVLLLLGSVAVSLVCLEAAVALILAYPALLPRGDGALGKPLALAGNYYRNRNRWVVQYLPECARYDPEVTYTLRPGGSCRVVNRHHVVEYSANRAGLRDTDAALDHPDAVVLGDSHAMGWGVDAAASFPKQLEQRLGRHVLNAAMSSFGTARQLTLLERLNLPSFAGLVIQYCENDFHENRIYIDDGGLEIRSETEYRAIVDRHLRTIRYYPFKHVRSLVGTVRRRIPPRKRTEASAESDTAEARYFLEVLTRHRQLIEGKTVVVLELNGYNRDDGGFIEALRGRLAEPRYADLARWVSAIDVSGGLEAADYLALDGHLRPQGHMKVARLVAEELRRGGL